MYRISDYIMVEEILKDSITISHKLTRRRMKVNKPLYEFFFVTHSHFSSKEIKKYDNQPEFKAIFEKLVEAGFLVNEKNNELDMFISNRLTEPAQPGFCYIPEYESEKEIDFTILGIPYCSNEKADLSPKKMPEILRQISTKLQYQLDPEQGKSKGWYDFAAKHPVLDNIRLADAGNVKIYPGESQTSLFARIAETVRKIRTNSKILVGIGGDHSVTIPILQGIQSSNLKYIHFDAHFDNSIYIPRLGVNHANILSAMREQKLVKDVWAFGIRGIGDKEDLADFRYETNISQISSNADFHAFCQGGCNVYISVDMDVFNPIVAPAVNYPETGGLMPEEFLFVFSRIARQCRIIGIDFVEYAPDKDINRITGHLTFELILKCLQILKEQLP